MYLTAHLRSPVNSAEAVITTHRIVLRDAWQPKHSLHIDRAHYKMENEKEGVLVCDMRSCAPLKTSV